MNKQLKGSAFILLAIYLVLFASAFDWGAYNPGENLLVDIALLTSLVVVTIGLVFSIKKDKNN